MYRGETFMSWSNAKGKVSANGRPWLVGLAVLTLLQGCSDKGKSVRESPPPTVVVTEVRVMDVPLVVTSNATTRAVGHVTVIAQVKGILKEVLFTEGTDVKKNQPLFVIDEEPFKVSLALAKAQRAEADASVKRSDQSKAREVAQAQLDLNLAALLLTQVDFQRVKLLFGRNAAAKGDLDLADANMKKAEAQVAANRASLDQAKADFETNILAAKAKMGQAEASVRDAEINLGYCRINAEIDGRIGEALVKVGNLVVTGQDSALATIQKLDPMGIEMQVSSRYLPRVTALVAQGLVIRVEVGVVDVRSFSGRVDFIDNVINRNTSTFLLKAKVPNPAKSLLPGEYARMFATIEDRKGVLVVPEKAIVETQAGTTVFLVGSDGKVVVAAVELEDDTYQGLKVVKSGLKAGQKVIVEGLQSVRQGVTVKTEDVRPDPLTNATEPPATR